MTKFNVGDKVIFNKENAHVAKQFDYKINKPYEVQEVFPFHCTVQIINEKGSSHSFDEERFELVETKPTKNQRITALEDTVAKQSEEISELKLIVHELRDKKAAYTTTVLMGGVPVDINNAPEIQLKAVPTVNQQRAAIIEKAKKFVDEHKSKYRSEWNIVGHTVQILIYDSNGMLMMFRQAKCSPNDVFNEHIGKAIALGRALGLDVSEFEQAVQPSEVVPGHIIAWDEVPDEPHKVIRRNGDWFDFTNLFNNKNYNNFEYCEIEEFTTIINDTNAKYEVSKQ